MGVNVGVGCGVGVAVGGFVAVGKSGVSDGGSGVLVVGKDVVAGGEVAVALSARVVGVTVLQAVRYTGINSRMLRNLFIGAPPFSEQRMTA